MKKLKVFLGLALILVLALALVGCQQPTTTPEPVEPADPEQPAAPDPAPAETINWVFNISSTGTATSPFGKTITHFVEKVEEESDGRLQIELHFGGALGYGASEMLEAISEGFVDGGDMSLPHIAGAEPLGNFGSMPFLHQGYDEYWDWLDNLLVPRLTPVLEDKWGVVPFGAFTFGQMYLLWNEPLNEVEQLRGQRFRVFGDINVKFFESLGVNVIYLGVEELQGAMERNMIDGMPNSNTLIGQLEAWEYYDYRNEMGAVIGSSLFGINEASFAALPADLQQIVLDAGREMTLAGRDYLMEDDARWDGELPDRGMETHYVPEETLVQMRELGKDAWIEWAAEEGGLAQEIMDETFAFIGIE